MFSLSSSPQSDRGYDCLSVEEQECLKFLEDTLESLDAETDSGLSTEEAEPSKHTRTWPTRDVPKGKPVL